MKQLKHWKYQIPHTIRHGGVKTAKILLAESYKRDWEDGSQFSADARKPLHWMCPNCRLIAMRILYLTTPNTNKYVNMVLNVPAQKPLGLSVGDGENGGDSEAGYGGRGRASEREIIYLSLHCHHQSDSCIKMGSNESHLNVSLIVRDKVTRRPSVSINHNFWRERRAEAVSNGGPYRLPAYRLTARPNRLSK